MDKNSFLLALFYTTLLLTPTPSRNLLLQLYNRACAL